MKRLRYIFPLAILATLTLQVFYVESLYNNFISENVIILKPLIKQKIEIELRSRSDLGRDHPLQEYRIIMPIAEDLMPEEMRNDPKVANSPRENTDSLIKSGRYMTYADAINEIRQDFCIERGDFLNVNLLDSLFRADSSLRDLQWRFVLRNTNGEILAHAGADLMRQMDWVETYPLGLRGGQKLEIAMNVPVKAFLMSDGGTLLGSLGMMVLVVVILVVQWCMLERLERRLRLQETHIGGIIHDLRSPLASVLMLLEAWRGRERDAAWQPLIDEGMKRVRTMAADIVRLLDATQLSHRRATLRWEQVDLAALVAALCEEYEQTYAAQPHTFRIENALPDGLTVRADRMLLTNVVRNLWENAMKYSDPGVCVTVRLTADGRHVRLSVADTGWGIRRSELRRVFALYYRSSHHGRKVKGFGIGLAKSRLSMKAMGGRLTVESREGEGSTFTVTLRRR